MEIARAADASYEHGDTGRFSGEVTLRGTVATEDGTNVGIVHFAAGARTHWHQHSDGQFLYAVVGRGRVRSRGEGGHVLEAGDVIHVAPGEWHFHGGTPDSALVHVAVNGGDPTWGDPVTEDEYNDGF
jgi:quercetin dioxygenase-like cupin family protein